MPIGRPAMLFLSVIFEATELAAIDSMTRGQQLQRRKFDRAGQFSPFEVGQPQLYSQQWCTNGLLQTQQQPQ